VVTNKQLGVRRHDFAQPWRYKNIRFKVQLSPKITFWPCAGDRAPPVELINELVESNPILQSSTAKIIPYFR